MGLPKARGRLGWLWSVGRILVLLALFYAMRESQSNRQAADHRLMDQTFRKSAGGFIASAKDAAAGPLGGAANSPRQPDSPPAATQSSAENEAVPPSSRDH